MRHLRLHVLMICLFSLALCNATRAEEAGKKAFLDNKCNLCHSIESEKIEKTTGGYQTSKEKNVPPDLTKIGNKRTAEWLKQYLLKKEKVDNVAHVRLFRGTESELKAITTWLETLK